jgi:protoporphyrinogen oxidase
MAAPVVVIGGGIGGATTALRLAQAGERVVLLERSPALGGLVVSFEVGGTPLECFYHHVFPHESDIVALVGELGLGGRLQWFPSSVGVYTDGRVWPFTSPLDLLRFRPLPWAERLRTGLGALRLGRRGDDDWAALDTMPARDWLAGATGERAAEVVWGPLLRAKFGPAADQVPAAWMWGRFRQRAGARRGGRERLGYLRGGFRQLFEAVEGELVRLGAEVRTGTAVQAIALDGDRVTGVETSDGPVEATAVVFTGPLPGLPGLVPPDGADPRWSAIGGLGVLCVVLELDHPLTDLYWVNVCDPEVPFGGIIEHTNLVPPADYGGRHVVYLSRYFTTDEPVAAADPDEEAARWVEVLDQAFPGAARHVRAIHPFRAPYAAPLVAVGHLSRIPPLAGPPAGLFVCTTAQIYPQDRGMDEGVRAGTATARAVRAAVSLARLGDPT